MRCGTATAGGRGRSPKPPRPTSFHVAAPRPTSAVAPCATPLRPLRQLIAVHGLAYATALSGGIAFVSVLFFTASLHLSCLVLATMAAILAATLALFQIAGWSIGAIEAVSLSVLMGLSVDFCVHFAEDYLAVLPRVAGARASVRRVRAVLGRVGAPLAHAAATTVLSCAVLFAAELRLLAQFGAIMAVTVALSLAFSVLGFCPLLALAGPPVCRRTARVRAAWLCAAGTAAGAALGLLWMAGFPITGPDGERWW